MGILLNPRKQRNHNLKKRERDDFLVGKFWFSEGRECLLSYGESVIKITKTFLRENLKGLKTFKVIHKTVTQ